MAVIRKSTVSPRPTAARVHASPRTRDRAALTAKNLFSKRPGDYTDSAVAGLTLRVLPSGARLWALRYRASRGAGRGPQRRLHFGTVGGALSLDLAALGLADLQVNGLGLEGARTVARALLGLAARGFDPVEALVAADRARRDREAEAERRRTLGTGTVGAAHDTHL